MLKVLIEKMIQLVKQIVILSQIAMCGASFSKKSTHDQDRRLFRSDDYHYNFNKHEIQKMHRHNGDDKCQACLSKSFIHNELLIEMLQGESVYV